MGVDAFTREELIHVGEKMIKDRTPTFAGLAEEGG